MIPKRPNSLIFNDFDIKIKSLNINYDITRLPKYGISKQRKFHSEIAPNNN